MKTLQEFVDTDVAAFLSNGDNAYRFNHAFFRKVPFPTIVDRRSFYSPASGTVLSQGIYGKDDQVLEIKGKNYTLKDIVMGDEEILSQSDKFIVISIFLSWADQHNNHLPYDSVYRKYKDIDPIQSKNKPMLDVETAIFNKLINPEILSKSTDYMFNNARRLSYFQAQHINIPYYIATIADLEVDVFSDLIGIDNKRVSDKNYVHQCEMFGSIRLGSQTDLIIPLGKEASKLNWEFLVPNGQYMHVESGQDPLLRIS